MGSGRNDAGQALAREVEALRLENARLRARVLFEEELGSEPARYRAIVSNLAEGVVLQGVGGRS